MSLEQDILQQVASASDEAALEAVRVATLGKKGSISEQMKALGAMGPEERKTAGAALNVLKDKVTEAIAARKAVSRKQACRTFSSALSSSSTSRFMASSAARAFRHSTFALSGDGGFSASTTRGVLRSMTLPVCGSLISMTVDSPFAARR